MKSRTILLGGAVSLFALYASTCCRTVGPGDSGELTVVMSTWGIAHAPGYPLLSLLGNIVSSMPFPGESALSLNLFTSACASLAAWVLAHAVLAATRDVFAAAFALFAFGTSRVVWEYALVTEVFALNNLAAATLLCCVAHFLRGVARGAPATWPLFAFGLVSSLAITHHLTLALVALPLLVVLAAVTPRLRRVGFDRARIGRVWLGATAVGVVGLAVVAYLPLAASAGPTLAWGNPDTFEGVVRLLARSDFGSSSLMNADFAAEKVMIEGEATSPLDGAHLRLYLAEMPRRLGLVFPALLLLGALVFVRRVGALGVLFLASFAGLMVLFFARANTPLTPLLLGVVERFSMLPDVVLVFLSGFGVAWLLAKLAARPAWRTALAVALLAATSGAAVVTHWVAVDQSGNTFTRDFGANLMSGMPEGALVFAQGDMFHNALHYQQDVLGRRPDLLVVDLQKLSYGWYLDDLRHRGQMTFPDGFAGYTGREGGDAAALLDAQRSPSGVDFARPVLVTRFGESSWSARYRLVDMGLWSQVVPRGREPSLTEQVADLTSAVSGWERASITRSYGARTWERNEQQGYAGAVARLAALTELAADVSAGAPRDEAGPVVDAWLALATGIAGGARAFVDALHAEAYARAATERIASSHVAPYLARALASARRARDLDPAELRALETLVDLQPLAPDRDLDEELALRAAHLDRRPADRLRLATWLELVNRRLKDPALDAGRRVALVGDAVRRQRRFLARVALARRLSDHASFRELEEAWSRDARTWEAGLAQMTQGSSR